MNQHNITPEKLEILLTKVREFQDETDIVITKLTFKTVYFSAESIPLEMTVNLETMK